MKICTNCGNKLTDDEKKCPVCKTRSKGFPVVDDSDTEKAAGIIEAVKTRNMNKTNVPVKKKNKGCLIAFIIIFALGIIGFIGNSTNYTKEADSTAEDKAPIVVTVDQMITDLNDNALNASEIYKGEYVEVTGRLSNIDSSGNYFSITEINKEYSLDSIICDIKEEHLEAVSGLKKGQKITVVGTIKSVGEVLGYGLDVDYIKQ